MTTVQARVARGATWLDEHYPNWWQHIDLATLDLSDCYSCVLGQVYTGRVSQEEKGQIIAQLVQVYTDRGLGVDSGYWQKSVAHWGGYNLIAEFHQLPDGGRGHGFLTADQFGDFEDYPELMDEWTQVIVSRRLKAHPDVRVLTVKLDELREKVSV